jgi:hypothetical protein
MKKNAVGGVLFAALLVIFILSCNELLIKGLRLRSVGDIGVWNRLVNGKINADVLICGSSRAVVHYNPLVISEIINQSVFNLGLNASLIDLQLPRLGVYLKYNKNPRLIIQNLDPFSLSMSTAIYNPKQYIPFLNEEKVYHTLRGIEPDFWKHKYIPLYSFAFYGVQFTAWSIRGWLGMEDRDHDIQYKNNGFMPGNLSWNEDFDKFKRKYPHGLNVPIDDGAIKKLEYLVAVAQSKGSKMIFVYSPEYYENYHVILNREQLFTVFKHIADKYTIPLWNYSGTPITQSKEFFYNSQHLNSKGANIFSELLAKELKGYLIVPERQ